MHLLTELHTVEIATDGDSQMVASADLCSDDSVEALRERTLIVGGSYFRIADRDALGTAFDDAFERCEAQPGDGVSGIVAFPGGRITVSRRLAA